MAHLGSTAASGGDDVSQLFILTRQGSGKPRWKVREFPVESINDVHQIHRQDVTKVVAGYWRVIDDKAANKLNGSCYSKKPCLMPNRVG